MAIILAVSNSTRPNVQAWVSRDPHNGPGYTVQVKTDDISVFHHWRTQLEALHIAYTHCQDL